MVSPDLQLHRRHLAFFDDDFIDAGIEPHLAAQVLEQLQHALDQRAGAALRKEHAPLPLQRMDQRIDRRCLERVAAHQQRMEAEGLAQLRVLDEARHHAVDAAVALELDQLRRHAHHAAEVGKRHMPELHVAFLQHGLGIGKELAVARHVGRRLQADLAVEFGLVVRIVETVAVFPAQPVERADRQHRRIVFQPAARQREQFLQRGRVGDDRRPGVEGEALVMVDVGAAAGLVALFQDERIDACRLQAYCQRQAPESTADHDCFDDDSFPVSMAALKAESTGTGGLPVSMRSWSNHVSRAA